jgi:hypothetical protein
MEVHVLSSAKSRHFASVGTEAHGVHEIASACIRTSLPSIAAKCFVSALMVHARKFETPIGQQRALLEA